MSAGGKSLFFLSIGMSFITQASRLGYEELKHHLQRRTQKKASRAITQRFVDKD